jgi:hypothetical protein
VQVRSRIQIVTAGAGGTEEERDIRMGGGAEYAKTFSASITA